jgi:hypothetical protein
MKKLPALAALATLALATTACGRQNAFPVPNKEHIKMNVPAAAGQALTVGETSEFYKFTLGTSVAVNGAVLGVFGIIEAILNLEPTEQDENHAVWGPSEPKGLEPLSHRFTVTKVDDETFSYKLEARKKGLTEESDFVVVFEGEAVPTDDDRGTGTLQWHLGSQRNLIETDCDLVGDITVTYDASAEPRALDVVFDGVADECKGETPHDAHYIYTEAQDGAGTMDFAIEGNIHNANENKPELEILAVRSRWLADGTGRSDVQVSGGEVDDDLATLPNSDQSTVDVVECWDASFATTYLDATPVELEAVLAHEEAGDASLCPFSEAEYASL